MAPGHAIIARTCALALAHALARAASLSAKRLGLTARANDDCLKSGWNLEADVSRGQRNWLSEPAESNEIRERRGPMAPVGESMSGGMHARELLCPEHLQLTPLVPARRAHRAFGVRLCSGRTVDRAPVTAAAARNLVRVWPTMPCDVCVPNSIDCA